MSTQTDKQAQAAKDVAMIARNGIDRVIELERKNTALAHEVDQLRGLADDLFATLTAALSLAPQQSDVYRLLDESVKKQQPRWLRQQECDRRPRARG